MTKKVEIFSAGCPACESTIELVNKIACGNCEVSVLDMKDDTVAKRAKDLGIHRVPAVAVDGKLADCCQVKAPTEDGLRSAGVGS